jgi:hypothetical protein
MVQSYSKRFENRIDEVLERYKEKHVELEQKAENTSSDREKTVFIEPNTSLRKNTKGDN